MRTRRVPGNQGSEKRKARKSTPRGIRKVSHIEKLENCNKRQTSADCCFCSCFICLFVCLFVVVVPSNFSLFLSGKLLYSPAKEFRPVRQASRRNTAGSLLNSPLEETAPTVGLVFFSVSDLCLGTAINRKQPSKILPK